MTLKTQESKVFINGKHPNNPKLEIQKMLQVLNVKTIDFKFSNVRRTYLQPFSKPVRIPNDDAKKLIDEILANGGYLASHKQYNDEDGSLINEFTYYYYK
ncbi:hypothetical protein Sf18_gp83 [Shigella phage Sf18]|uniref:Uncharacterized protein n=4 Tax=Mooglevirus TaxID=1985303 RepID=A0A291AYI0_9CAUD|nr:hypothetical protein FDI44_gp104 [Shigella phage Sf13]ATE85845.1 hypothetical protein Sf13_gp45 [Shigella phage Sf13]ATE86064.1 hypothetical protein Sf15_gp131 [Shigella phage Sf15]ATE86357.1 hypothetical protein Sf18_gp83 [Shigella phage Sf18]AUV56348.1 hypothetical protein Sf19_gp132 [Shigella phage Sf19]